MQKRNYDEALGDNESRATVVLSTSKIEAGSCCQIDPDCDEEMGGMYVTITGRNGRVIMGYIVTTDGDFNWSGDVDDVLWIGDAQWFRNDEF